MQPKVPLKYRVPGVVQPKWKIRDLVNSAKLGDCKDLLIDEICNQYSVKYCVLLNNARSGIALLANSYGLKNEWLTTSYMYKPLADIILKCANGLALADINEDFTIDTSSINSIVRESTEVLLINHFFGKVSNLEELKQLANKYKLFLIENCVHIPGKTIASGLAVGSWGDAAILSFKADKAIGGIGGGALITNRKDVWDAVNNKINESNNTLRTLNYALSNIIVYKLRPYISLLIRLKNTKLKIKGNNKIDNLIEKDINWHNIERLQAAVAQQLLVNNDELNKSQKEKGIYLSNKLSEVSEISIPPNVPHSPHAYTYFPILIKSKNRDVLANKLSEKGIETKWRYHALHSCFKSKKLRWDYLEKTIKISKNNLLLPLGHLTSKSHIQYIADCLKSVTTTCN